jgi:hypothetical protein
MSQPITRGKLAISSASDNECRENHESVGQSPLERIKVSWRGQRPIVERFWANVNKNGPIHPKLGTPCWLWTASVLKNGYAAISLGHPRTAGSKRWRLHRFSWELHNGPIPDGLCVCHRCDVRHCVNPAHLFLGTHAENVHDSVHKGRHSAGFIHQKLIADDVRVIREQARRGLDARDIASAFGVHRSVVYHIVNRTRWAHLPKEA